MKERFGDFPEALSNTVDIASRCNLELEFGKLHMPDFPIPEGYKDLDDYLKAESEEGLSSMEEALMTLERQPRDEEAVATVFRVAHTLKGTAAMFDFTGVERLAHALEELLDRLRQHSIEVTGELVSLLLRAVDVLRETIPEAAAGRGELRPGATSMLE